MALPPLPDYSVSVPDINRLATPLLQGFEDRRERTALSNIGQQIQGGDYAGAAGSAFKMGNLNAGLDIMKLSQAEKDKVRDIVGRYVQMADTPEKWERIIPILSERLGPQVAEEYGGFEQREMAMAELGVQPEVLKPSDVLARDKFAWEQEQAANEPPPTIESFDENGNVIIEQWDVEKREYVPISGAKVDQDAKDKFQKGETDLRKEFTANSKVFKDVSDSYGRVIASSDTAAGHMALVFNFMKMLDPGSAVRETEYANAQNASGVPARIRAQWNKLVSGEFLPPAQRQDFLTQSKSLYDQASRQHKGIVNQFTSFAKKYGYDPANVIIDYGNPGDLIAGPAEAADPLGIR